MGSDIILRANFKVNNIYKKYELEITNKYGFIDLSVSPFIKKTKDTLIANNCKKILDLGCGNGKHSIYLNTYGFDVYASDIDCSKIIKNVQKLNLTSIKIREHSFTDIPYENNFFDSVICTSTLHHATYKDINQAISEIHRILRPNGYFIFDFLSKLDSSYGIGTKIEDNTFIGSRSGEENIPHHYTDENELKLLLNNFSCATINKSIYSFHDSKNNEYLSKVFDVLTIK